MSGGNPSTNGGKKSTTTSAGASYDRLQKKWASFSPSLGKAVGPTKPLSSPSAVSLSLPRLRAYQMRAFLSTARDDLTTSAPQLGKSLTGQLWILTAAWLKADLPFPWWWTAPTFKQSRKAIMEIASLCRKAGILKRSTTTAPLEVELINGARIEGHSWDSPEHLQGATIAGGVLDEFGLLDQESYKTISARRAETVIHGLGFFRYYGNVGEVGGYAEGLWERAKAGQRGMACRTWTWRDRAEDLPCACPVEDQFAYELAEEHAPTCKRARYLEHIKNEAGRLSKKEFGRLYNAEWEDTTDLPVYVFDRHLNSSVHFAQYDPHLPIAVCCDFNVDPMSWTLGQEKDGHAWTFDLIQVTGADATRTAARELKRRFPNPKFVNMVIYGDATGKARSPRSKLSDYEIISEVLAGYKLEFDVPTVNPPVTRRVDSVNARLCNALGEARYHVNPDTCRALIRDLSRVSWKSGTREIDKRDKTLTHLSDGVGYWLHHLYGVVEQEQPSYVPTPSTGPSLMEVQF